MTALPQETTRFSTSLLTRGVLLVFLGIAAIGWPESALVVAMLTSAALLLVMGAFEMFLALRARDATRGWMVPLANGAACIVFGLLTLVFPSISLRFTLLLVAVWLLLYAAMTGALALALWPMPRTRRVLLAWTALNVLLALLAIGVPSATVITLLYVGAGYAVAFGALHIAYGIWVRRIAVPYVAPTMQSSWSASPRK